MCKNQCCIRGYDFVRKTPHFYQGLLFCAFKTSRFICGYDFVCAKHMFCRVIFYLVLLFIKNFVV